MMLLHHIRFLLVTLKPNSNTIQSYTLYFKVLEYLFQMLFIKFKCSTRFDGKYFCVSIHVVHLDEQNLVRAFWCNQLIVGTGTEIFFLIVFQNGIFAH